MASCPHPRGNTTTKSLARAQPIHFCVYVWPPDSIFKSSLGWFNEKMVLFPEWDTMLPYKKVEVGLRNLPHGKQGPIMLACEIAKLGTGYVTKQGVGP